MLSGEGRLGQARAAHVDRRLDRHEVAVLVRRHDGALDSTDRLLEEGKRAARLVHEEGAEPRASRAVPTQHVVQAAERGPSPWLSSAAAEHGGGSEGSESGERCGGGVGRAQRGGLSARLIAIE